MRSVLVLGVILALLSPVYGQMGPEMMGNWTGGYGPGMMGGNWSGGPGYGMMNPQMMAMMMQGGMMGHRGGYSPGMTGYRHGYKGTADTVIHYLFWILLLAIMASVLYLLLVKKVCPGGGRAVETVRERYARGEINEEEYKRMKATLKER